MENILSFQWTYQAMIHELIGIKNNTVDLSGRPGKFFTSEHLNYSIWLIYPNLFSILFLQQDWLRQVHSSFLIPFYIQTQKQSNPFISVTIRATAF